jgi:class 3 adenylate cyclase
MSEDQATMDTQDTPEALLQRGREAFLSSAWSEAYDALAISVAEGALSPDDLDALGQAAHATGRLDEAIRAHEAAFSGYVQAGDRRRAAIVAMWQLSVEYWNKGLTSVADGWDQRAARLLEDEPECVEHGWIAFGLGDTDRALELARRFGDRTLEARCLHRRGRELVDQGRVTEGMALIDEVCATIAAGEIRPYEASILYCLTTGLCVGVADYRRAREWSEITYRYVLGFGPSVFSSICRVNRAEIMNVRGSWDEAEREALAAIEELHGLDPEMLGLAFRELGEVRMKRGDLEGAEEAFRQAHEAGVLPQPGLALLRLAQGKPDAALSLIKRTLEEEPGGRPRRMRALLPALVTIALEAGNRESARSAADELGEAGEEYGTPALRAGAAGARGAVQLADGQMGEAAKSLRKSLHLWTDADAPYEAARVRLLLGQTYLTLGETESAVLELDAARSAFEHLGALPDAKRAEDLLQRAVLEAVPMRAFRTFLFTDIVGSTALIEAIGDEAWEGLHRWHDESLRHCFAEHGGGELDHAGDGFFVAFPNPRAAVDCAAQIQRRLAEHRQEHGFAPQVRIGVHAAEAMRSGGSFTGRGVHAAARIAALAEGGEILASVDTIKDLDGFRISEPRVVTLKGIAQPVQVVSLDWR